MSAHGRAHSGLQHYREEQVYRVLYLISCAISLSLMLHGTKIATSKLTFSKICDSNIHCIRDDTSLLHFELSVPKDRDRKSLRFQIANCNADRRFRKKIAETLGNEIANRCASNRIHKTSPWSFGGAILNCEDNLVDFPVGAITVKHYILKFLQWGPPLVPKSQLSGSALIR